MPMVPFINSGTFRSRSKDVADTRSLNLYTEIVGTDKKAPKILIGTPGTAKQVTFDGPEGLLCRGLYTTSTSRLFTVFGSGVYEVFADDTQIKRFNISPGGSTVYMADDGKYLVLVDGATMTYYDLENNAVINHNSHEDILTPTRVIYTNYRFVVINKNDDKFYFSDFENRLNWDALDFYTAESSADKIRSIISVAGMLWVFGDRSYEVWQPVPSADNPWARVAGAASEIGIGAPNSLCTVSDRCFFLGGSVVGSGGVYMSNGYGVDRISNPGIEYELGQLKSLSDAISFTYQQEGHIFYVLTFPIGNKTFVFDLSTQEWHERSSRHPTLNIQNRWEPIYSAFAFDKTYCGSLAVNALLTLSLDKYDEHNGNAITRLHQSPVYWDDLRQVQYKEFVLDLETGVGRQVGQGSDPKIMLQYSKDGGHTWSSEDWRSIGKIGEYRHRVAWRRFGLSREIVFRIVITDPVKVVIIGAKVDTARGGR